MALTTPSGASSFGFDNNNVPGAPNLYSSWLVAGDLTNYGSAQIGPFFFDYRGDECARLDNEITDHWVEDNTAVQDHIGVLPVIVSLRGKISELTLTTLTEGLILSSLATVENGLSQLDQYLGKYTPGTTQVLLNIITQAESIAIQIEQTAARIAQIASFFAGVQATKQQQAFAQLSALRNARTIFTVFTPWQVFNSMVIEGLEVRQSEKTVTQSEISVSMKQLQFTDNISQSSFYTQYGGNAAYSYQPQASNGIANGVQTAASKVAAFF